LPFPSPRHSGEWPRVVVERARSRRRLSAGVASLWNQTLGVTRGTPRTRRAFTLLEVVIVILIIGMLAGVAVPRLSMVTLRNHADAAAQRIAYELEYAASLAERQSADQQVIFDAAADTLELVGVSDPDRPGSPYLVRLNQPPYRADVQSASFGIDSSVIFDGFGQPDTAGTVVLQVGDFQKTVTLDATTGRASRQ